MAYCGGFLGESSMRRIEVDLPVGLMAGFDQFQPFQVHKHPDLQPDLW